MDINSKVSSSERNNARLDRNQTVNPPVADPGMLDIDWGSKEEETLGNRSESLFESQINTPWSVGATSDHMNRQPMPPMQSPFINPFNTQNRLNNNTTEQTLVKSTEDKFFDVLKKVAKGFYSFSGELVNSFKEIDALVMFKMGRLQLMVGTILSVLGVLLALLGQGYSFGFTFIVSGLLVDGIGVIIFMYTYDTLLKEVSQGEEEQRNEIKSQLYEDSEDNFMFSDEDEDSDFDFEKFIDTSEEEYEEYKQGSIPSSDNDFNMFDDFVEPVKAVSFESTLDNLSSNMGMVTRQYLYENISRCLSGLKPDFDRVRTIQEDSTEFDSWDSVVQNSANLFKPKSNEVDSVYLISAKEKLFYYILEINRASWLKNVESFVSEIVNICRFNEDTATHDMTMYGVGTAVGGKIFVKIMKGETAMISLRDTYSLLSKEVLNTGILMPVVLGLDVEGKPILKDFKDVNSILVTGMPRSGKTWTVLSMIAQMAFFLKPSELEFRVLDPKDNISDFKFLEIPHIRKFVSTDEGIISELRRVVREEGPRRKKIIGNAGFVNIWDFKKRNPDTDLPLLYIIIDEVVTLAERMDKEVKDEFQSLLLELVSQLPALGIRLFMIPHIVKDNILKKSITDLIPCRISVMGDSDHIERSLGVKNFKHKLTHAGDIAVKFFNDEPNFIHSVVLTDSNESNFEFFDFLKKFWLKLQPDSYQGSVAQQREGVQSTGKPQSNFHYVSLESKPSSSNSSSSRNTLSDSDLRDLLSKVNEDSEEINLWDE